MKDEEITPDMIVTEEHTPTIEILPNDMETLGLVTAIRAFRERVFRGEVVLSDNVRELCWAMHRETALIWSQTR
jgi:hypothetical protein